MWVLVVKSELLHPGRCLKLISSESFSWRPLLVMLIKPAVTVFSHLVAAVHQRFETLLSCVFSDFGSDDQQVPVFSDPLFWNPYWSGSKRLVFVVEPLPWIDHDRVWRCLCVYVLSPAFYKTPADGLLLEWGRGLCLIRFLWEEAGTAGHQDLSTSLLFALVCFVLNWWSTCHPHRFKVEHQWSRQRFQSFYPVLSSLFWSSLGHLGSVRLDRALLRVCVFSQKQSSDQCCWDFLLLFCAAWMLRAKMINKDVNKVLWNNSVLKLLSVRGGSELVLAQISAWCGSWDRITSTWTFLSWMQDVCSGWWLPGQQFWSGCFGPGGRVLVLSSSGSHFER